MSAAGLNRSNVGRWVIASGSIDDGVALDIMMVTPPGERRHA